MKDIGTVLCLAWAFTVNTVAADDVEDLLGYLEAGDIAAMEVLLGERQRAYEADPDREDAAHEPYLVFERAFPEDLEVLDRWVEQYPDSYPARIARGNYWASLGWKRRGTAYISNTPEVRLQGMREAHARATGDFEAALKLTARPLSAYVELIGLARTGSDRFAELLDATQQHVPDSRQVISTLAWTLRPRWGGSYTTLERLAASVRKAGDVERNRLAGFVEGLIFYDQGDLALARKEHDTALGLFARAVELSDHPTFRLGQGRALFALGQAAKVRGLLEGQLEASPHYTELLLWLAHTAFVLMDNDQGVAYLRRAVRLGNTKAVALLGHALTYGGRGQKRDLVAGMRLLELSGHYYDASMLFNLGKLHELGQGVPVDHAKAVAYYERASALGDLPASNDLGIMLWYGRGTPSDKPRAARLWHAAAAAGIWQAETNLNYFLSPTERIRLALELGAGWWLLKPALGFAAVLFGLGYLLYAARRRRRLRHATTALFDELGLAEALRRSGNGDPSDGWRAAVRFILIGGVAAVVVAYLAVHLVRDFLPTLVPYLDLFREHFIAIVTVCTLLAVLIWQRGRRRSYARGDNPFRIAYGHLVNGRQRHAIAYLLSVPGSYPEAAGVAQLVGRLRTR